MLLMEAAHNISRKRCCAHLFLNFENFPASLDLSGKAFSYSKEYPQAESLSESSFLNGLSDTVFSIRPVVK
jgi:hypothetical protein|tara:strand:- start:856 stop:1068 length:213 start_codon:yes stop_codon:yes gene_type:complete